MPADLHQCLTELRMQLAGLLQEEAECLRQALEISRSVGQGPQFDAAMRKVESTRIARGALLKHIHELEGRADGHVAPLAGREAPPLDSHPSMAPTRQRPGGLAHA